jgi:hypothetical protein
VHWPTLPGDDEPQKFDWTTITQLENDNTDSNNSDNSGEDGVADKTGDKKKNTVERKKKPQIVKKNEVAKKGSAGAVAATVSGPTFCRTVELKASAPKAAAIEAPAVEQDEQSAQSEQSEQSELEPEKPEPIKGAKKVLCFVKTTGGQDNSWRLVERTGENSYNLENWIVSVAEFDATEKGNTLGSRDPDLRDVLWNKSDSDNSSDNNSSGYVMQGLLAPGLSAAGVKACGANTRLCSDDICGGDRNLAG